MNGTARKITPGTRAATVTGRPERNAAGVYAELALAPADPVEVELGLRGDGWIIAGRREQAIDPVNAQLA